MHAEPPPPPPHPPANWERPSPRRKYAAAPHAPHALHAPQAWAAAAAAVAAAEAAGEEAPLPAELLSLVSEQLDAHEAAMAALHSRTMAARAGPPPQQAEAGSLAEAAEVAGAPAVVAAAAASAAATRSAQYANWRGAAWHAGTLRGALEATDGSCRAAAELHGVASLAARTTAGPAPPGVRRARPTSAAVSYTYASYPPGTPALVPAAAPTAPAVINAAPAPPLALPTSSAMPAAAPPGGATTEWRVRHPVARPYSAAPVYRYVPALSSGGPAALATLVASVRQRPATAAARRVTSAAAREERPLDVGQYRRQTQRRMMLSHLRETAETLPEA